MTVSIPHHETLAPWCCPPCFPPGLQRSPGAASLEGLLGWDRQGSPVRFPYIGITGLQGHNQSSYMATKQARQVCPIHTINGDFNRNALTLNFSFGVYMIGFDFLGIDTWSFVRGFLVARWSAGLHLISPHQLPDRLLSLCLVIKNTGTVLYSFFFATP